MRTLQRRNDLSMKSYSTYFFFLLLLLSQHFAFSQKLQNRELLVFPKNFEVKHKCIFENDKPFLVIAVPAYNYRLSLKAYSEYPGKAQLLWQSEPEFRDSVSEIRHLIPLDLTNIEFALEIKIINSNNQLLYQDIAYVSASDVNTQIYLCDINNVPLLDNYLKGEDFFKISHNKEGVLKFHLSYFPDPAAPAPAPASANNGFFNPEKDKAQQHFTVNRGREIKLSEKGIFYVQVDTNSGDGIFTAYYGEDFPSLSNVAELVLATRYITKNEEYNKMTSAANMKAALDEYWLSRNKNEQEAKRLISLYYNRMKEANRRFSYAKEGWKTDMGMIFTIFGKPQIVRKYEDKTIWYYSHSNGRDPVEFVFQKLKGQYLLERSSYLKEPWNAEIIKWRLGKAN